MKITTAEEMRGIDRATAERFGVPTLTLMENAGTAVANAAVEWFPKARRIVIVCGKGNNGGDGFVAARKLVEAGKDVATLLLADPAEVGGDASEMLSKINSPLHQVRSGEEIGRYLAEADLIIDGILGTGFRPPVSGLYSEAIQAINSATAPVLAIDIPSGADADAMAPAGDALIARADCVVTFTAPRPAHIFAHFTRGRTRVVSIGSPNEAVTSELGMQVISAADFSELLKPRSPEGHKGKYGHVLVVGGSLGKTGAAGMAGLSALRAGAGLVTIATARSAQAMVAAVAPELMTEPLAETGAGTMSLTALEYGRLDRLVRQKDVLAIGPGISRHTDTEQFVRAVVPRYKVPTVIDADGLNAFEGRTEELDGTDRVLVLTPHPGEMARLTGLSTAEIQQDRISTARKFAIEHKLYLVLKGHRTIVAMPDGCVWVNPTGNPGMATGGTGDVLTGLVAGLLAQSGSDAARAVIAGVYLHGLAGDIACERMGEQAMIATDLIAAMPEAIRRAKAQANDAHFEF